MSAWLTFSLTFTRIFHTELWNKLEANNLIVSYIPVSNNTKDLIYRAPNMNRHILSKIYLPCDCAAMHVVLSAYDGLEA